MTTRLSLRTTLSPIGSVEGDGNRTRCVAVSLVDNFAYEKNESFFVNITSEPGVVIPTPNVTVVIEDDEGIIAVNVLYCIFQVGYL